MPVRWYNSHQRPETYIMLGGGDQGTIVPYPNSVIGYLRLGGGLCQHVRNLFRRGMRRCVNVVAITEVLAVS
jgi:hypothetical protein